MSYESTGKLRRKPKVRAGELAAYFAKLPHDSPDIVLHNEVPAQRCDAHLLHSFLNHPTYDYKGVEQPPFLKQLVDRGYDINTFRFSISKKTISAASEKEREQ